MAKDRSWLLSGHQVLDLEKGRTDGWLGTAPDPTGSKFYKKGHAEGVSDRARKNHEQAVQRQLNEQNAGRTPPKDEASEAW